MNQHAAARRSPGARKRDPDDEIRRQRTRTLNRACRKLLGVEVESVVCPGGRTRESYLLRLADGREIIGTERDTALRARIEARVISTLDAAGAPVPALFASDGGTVLLQQALSGPRLSARLQEAGSEERFALLNSALQGLRAAQLAGNDGGLAAELAELGTGRTWLLDLINQPARIGDYLDVPCPVLDKGALMQRLILRERSFIKWDARPGNAIVDAAGTVHWFDWEHAGVRCSLDDMAWLLGDEYVADDPAMESRLLQVHLQSFAGTMAFAEALDYLRVFGTLHMCVRLGLILKYMEGTWWDLERCISRDKVGVTLECARSLCNKGTRWSAEHPLTAPLSAWFKSVQAAIERL